jgi:hypothetical protein
MNLSFAFYIIFAIMSLESLAFAFPDTVRHGYANCTTCHVSPAGGGLLTNYGRSLSRELISTWGQKNEEKILNGVLENDTEANHEGSKETFYLGGDTRYLSRKLNAASSQVDEGFLMQAQLRLGWAFDNFKFIMNLGKIENPRASSEIKLLSSEFYTIWSPKEELYVRIGRFEPIYGLRLPDHNLWIKSEIGLVPWAERDSVEFIYEGEKQFASLSGFQSTSAMAITQQATGYSFSFNQILAETSRVGISLMNSEGQGFRSKAFSGHGIFSMTEKTYTMTELTRIRTADTSRDIGFLRIVHEQWKGFLPYIQGQIRLDANSPSVNQNRKGVGFIWYPRPHFELMASVDEIKTSQENSSEILFLMHYYL